MRINEPVTNVEYVLDDNDVILSKTNMTGHITYVNDTLIRITGFSEEELIGQPHNIFRHPDMPPEAFQDLWDTIRAGENWRGYVKNRCKNGDYYWVDASVTPNFEHGKMIGFTSYRVKAPRDVVNRLDALYRDIREGRATHLRLSRGKSVARGPLGAVARLRDLTIKMKMGLAMLFFAVMGLGSTVAATAALVDTWMLLGLLSVGLAAAGSYGWSVMRDFGRRMTVAVQVMQGVSSGNFNQRVDNDSRDEIGQLMGSLRNMVGNLRETITKVNAATDTVNLAASEISAGNDDLSQRTEEQSASLEETASSMEELTGTVKRNADNAREANELACVARDEAVRGGEVLRETVGAMSAINESSKRIADIIGVIDEIAFQTNLLALNAAVESARAGEHGRGFAVVASEVRNLAQRSSSAANEIKDLITDSVEKARSGSDVVDRSCETLNAIVERVKQVSEIITEIAAASQEQSSGIEQVNKAVVQMDQMTQQNAALVEEAAANAKAMEEQAQQLKMVTGYFTLDGSETDAAARRVRGARQQRRHEYGSVHGAGVAHPARRPELLRAS